MPEWLAVLIILLVLVTSLAATVVCCVALILSLGTRRWQPAATGLIAGAVTLATTTQFSFAAPLRVVLLPLVAAAAAAILMFRKQDWDALTAPNPAATSTGERIAIAVAGLCGLGLGVATGIGKPVLNALNQDVVGVLRSEKIEIAVAGGFVGAGCGVVLGMLVVSAFWPRRGRGQRVGNSEYGVVARDHQSSVPGRASANWPISPPAAESGRAIPRQR